MALFKEKTMSMQNLPPWLPAEFEARFEPTPGSVPTEKDLAHWQQLCRELIEEREGLQKELAQAKLERDQYLQDLYFLTHEDIPFTKEEVFERLGKSPFLEDLIKEFRDKG